MRCIDGAWRSNSTFSCCVIHGTDTFVFSKWRVAFGTYGTPTFQYTVIQMLIRMILLRTIIDGQFQVFGIISEWSTKFCVVTLFFSCLFYNTNERHDIRVLAEWFSRTSEWRSFSLLMAVVMDSQVKSAPSTEFSANFKQITKSTMVNLTAGGGCSETLSEQHKILSYGFFGGHIQKIHDKLTQVIICQDYTLNNSSRLTPWHPGYLDANLCTYSRRTL